MPTHSRLFTILLAPALLLIAGPVLAQGSGPVDAGQPPVTQRSTVASQAPDTESFEGEVSTDDMADLCRFTAWAFERLVQSADPSLSLPENAPTKALDFWIYVWPSVDPETKHLISQMDQIWPAVQDNWESAGTRQRDAIVGNIRDLLVTVWGKHVASMASYMAGEITYDQFAPAMDEVVTTWYSASGANEGSGAGTDESQSYGLLADSLDTYWGNFIDVEGPSE